MAKINIPFNNTNYSIDESSLSAASAALKSHLQNVMNGSGAVINLDGVSYNIDSTKLSNATNDFVAHLGTISGSGKKIIVNNIEYAVDSAKMNDAIAELDTVLSGLQNPGLPAVGKTFEECTWEEIARISEAGQATKYFKVGDTKVITNNGYSYTIAIAGFDHDNLADGSGKAGITCVMMTVPSQSNWTYQSAGNLAYGSDFCELRKQEGYILTSLLTSVNPYIKTVSKEYDNSNSSGTSPSIATADCRAFSLSLVELGYDNSTELNYISTLGSRYELFPLSQTLDTVLTATGTEAEYWTRQLKRVGTYAPMFVTTSGRPSHTSSNLSSKYKYMRIGFCI